MDSSKYDGQKEMARMAYITSVRSISLRELANKFNIPISTMSEWSTAEQWVKQREEMQREITSKVESDYKKSEIKRRKKMIDDLDDIIAISIDKLKIELGGEGKITPANLEKLVRMNELLKGNASSRAEKKIIVESDKPIDKMSIDELNKVKLELIKTS